MVLDGFVNRIPIVDSVAHEMLDLPFHLIQEVRNLTRVLLVILREFRGMYPPLLIDTQMQFPPMPSLLFAVLLGVPLPLSTNLQPRGVDDEIDRPRRQVLNMSAHVDRLIPPGQSRVIRTGQIEPHQPQQEQRKPSVCLNG